MLATKNDLDILLNARGSLCISIYLPVHGNSPQQNAIRARNLIRKAELEAARLTCSTDAHNLLHPLDPLLISQAQEASRATRGLAAFNCAFSQRVLALPVEFPEHVAVGYHFYLRPLLPFYRDAEHFQILALSQKQIRLFEADRFDIAEIPTELIAAPVPDFAKELQFHLTAAGSGHGAVVYHGGRDEPKDRLASYLRHVHSAVHTALRSHTGPLVLAAVDYVASLYESVNRDCNLASRHVDGNPDLSTPQELHAKAWAIVEPCFVARQEREIAKYQELDGTGLTSSSLNEILAHAGNGRVRALFLQSDAHETDQSGEDLLNAAAIATVRNGGLVYEIPCEQMPTQESAAALYRY